MTVPSERIKVMLVDDEAPVRQAYSLLLENDGRAIVVGEAEDQEDALSKLAALAQSRERRPDVIILDLHVPRRFGERIDSVGGISLIPKMRALCAEARILIATQAIEEDPIIDAFAAGADGYVWKNEAGDAIATAVQKIHAGELVATVSIAQKVMNKLDGLRANRPVVLPLKRRHKRLSDLLYRTMKLYCFDGLSAREIAEREYVSLDAVNSRIKKAFEILGVSGKRDAFRRMTELSEDTT